VELADAISSFIFAGECGNKAILKKSPAIIPPDIFQWHKEILSV
jgi:hypothetical protein